MADIELVIKIPEEMHKKIMDGYVPLGISKYLKNGTPLPKGHGRLIDADKLITSFDGECGWTDEINIINRAETVLKADVKELG